MTAYVTAYVTAYDCPDCGFKETEPLTLNELSEVVQTHANKFHNGKVLRGTRLIGWVKRKRDAKNNEV